MPRDPLDLVDEWGPEKIVLVSDHKSAMRGGLVIDNTARGYRPGPPAAAPAMAAA